MSLSLTNVLQALRIVPSPANKLHPVHKSFPQKPLEGVLPSGLREITLDEVSQHDDFRDCWIVLYDRVYDVTKFLNIHPGSSDVILDYAGRDATIAFHGTGHSNDAVDQLGDYLIGELPIKERIFRNKNAKIKLRDIPV